MHYQPQHASQPLVGTDLNQSAFRFLPASRYQDVAFIFLFLANLIGFLALMTVTLLNVGKVGQDGDWSQITKSDFFSAGLVGLFAALFLGVIWLQIIKNFPSAVIWMTLFMSVLISVGLLAVGVYFKLLFVIIMSIVMVFLQLLYIYIVRTRIPFAAAMLRLIARLVTMYPATVVVAVLSLIPAIGVALAIGVTIEALVVNFNNKRNTNYNSNNNNGQATDDPVFDMMIVYLVFTLYWTTSVIKNVVHMTTAGCFASFYFSAGRDNPTLGALKRATTTSFGSVCLGSLIVAVLETIRFIIKSSSRSRNGLVRCIALCLLDCITNLVKLFNKYAYSYCAIYGLPFVSAAKRTWELFKSSGFSGVVNDDMITGVCGLGALIAGLLVGGGGAVYAHIKHDNTSTTVLFGVLLGFLAFAMVIVVLEPVASGAAVMYVCFAEAPADLAISSPEDFNNITQAYQARYGSPWGVRQQPQQQQQFQQQQQPMHY